MRNNKQPAWVKNERKQIDTEHRNATKDADALLKQLQKRWDSAGQNSQEAEEEQARLNREIEALVQQKHNWNDEVALARYEMDDIFVEMMEDLRIAKLDVADITRDHARTCIEVRELQNEVNRLSTLLSNNGIKY